MGRTDSQPIGYAAKTPDKIIVSQFPDIETLQKALSTKEALTLKDQSVEGLGDYLAYRAYPSSNWQELLSEESR